MEPALIAGRYRVMRAVGRGGMGTVWLCWDEVLHREVAAKQIEGLGDDPVGKAARPLREARLTASVSHPNAVSIFDIVEHEGSTWLVMEYVPSVTLAELLRQEGRLPVVRVVRIGAQLASALAAAHALGIIHRDIKPGNVLVGENDLAKISDFGIARGHLDEQLTLTGFVTGTPAYFSPELARGGDPSQAADVWALGATLYAAVEGGPPYGKDSNPLALVTKIASQPPPRPTRAGELTSTLSSMLNPKAEARASMEAVVSSLHKLAAPADVEAARLREKRRGYDDTTLHDKPMAVLDEMLRPPPDRGVDDQTTISSPALGSARGAAPPPEDADSRKSRGRPSPALLVVGLAILLVLLIAGTLVWALVRSTGGDGTTASSAGGSPDHSGASTNTTGVPGDPTRTHNTGTSSASPPEGSPSTSEPPPRPPPGHSGQGPAAFVTSYFDTVPADLRVGWKLLSPSMRKIGHDSYDRFWGSIDSIDVADVKAVSSHTVAYQITYHFSDGRVVQEKQQIDLVPHAHSFWINDDTVLSSTTLHP